MLCNELENNYVLKPQNQSLFYMVYMCDPPCFAPVLPTGWQQVVTLACQLAFSPFNPRMLACVERQRLVAALD